MENRRTDKRRIELVQERQHWLFRSNVDRFRRLKIADIENPYLDEDEIGLFSSHSVALPVVCEGGAVVFEFAESQAR